MSYQQVHSFLLAGLFILTLDSDSEPSITFAHVLYETPKQQLDLSNAKTKPLTPLDEATHFYIDRKSLSVSMFFAFFFIL